VFTSGTADKVLAKIVVFAIFNRIYDKMVNTKAKMSKNER